MGKKSCNSYNCLSMHLTLCAYKLAKTCKKKTKIQTIDIKIKSSLTLFTVKFIYLFIAGK